MLLETFDVDGEERRAVQLGLPATLAPGYHRLEMLEGIEPLAHATLIVAPDRCYLPETLAQGGRAWGAALQLYALRSARNWGIGDFTDLAIVVEQWGARGANIVGVNPLHALFLHDPGAREPVQPVEPAVSERAVPRHRGDRRFRATAESARDGRRARAEFLRRLEARCAPPSSSTTRASPRPSGRCSRLLYAAFSRRSIWRATAARASAFAHSCAQRGEALRRHALFEALQAAFPAARPAAWGWPPWPADVPRSRRRPRCGASPRTHADARRIFRSICSGRPSCSSQRSRRAAPTLGLAVGLYTDLAVSVDRGGADAWANQDCTR